MRRALSPSQLSWHWPHKGIPLAQGIAASSPKENHNPGYWPFQAHNFFGQLPLPCSIWCHLHPPTACSLADSHDPQCQPWLPFFKKIRICAALHCCWEFHKSHQWSLRTEWLSPPKLSIQVPCIFAYGFPASTSCGMHVYLCPAPVNCMGTHNPTRAINKLSINLTIRT